jgi:hypothetical protein
MVAVIASVLTVVVGLLAKGWQWGVLGTAVGVPGLVLPFLLRHLRWSAPWIWLVVGLVVVLDLGVVWAISTNPGT